MTDATPFQLGPIGDRVLFEDDKIRVWEMVLEPNERSPAHHHAHDYVIVVCEGDHVTVQPVPGSEERSGEGYGALVVTPGEAVALHGGATEVAINSGKIRYRDIQIEFLDQPLSV